MPSSRDMGRRMGLEERVVVSRLGAMGGWMKG